MSLWRYRNVILSLRFNGHFPRGRGLAGTQMSPFWTLQVLRVIIDALQKTSEKYNMKINTKKTKVMTKVMRMSQA